MAEAAPIGPRPAAGAGVRPAGFARRLAGGLAAWLFAASATAAQTYIDDTGQRIELRAPARRIVSLAPNLTEIVYALGAEARLVAVDGASDFPPAVRTLERIGDFQRIDVERLVALKPDLVLFWPSGNTQRELAQLRAAGIALFGLEPRRLADVPRAIERVGALLGLAEAGAAQADRLRGELQALAQAHATSARLSVFYQVWQRPLLTLKDDHLVSDVIRLCGGRNAFGALAPLVPELSIEAVRTADPQVILSAHRNAAPGAGAVPQRDPDDAAFAEWRRFPAMRAVRAGALYTLPADTLTRQGPRIAEGARAACAALDEVRRGGAVPASPPSQTPHQAGSAASKRH